MQFDAAGGLFLKTMLFLANHTDQYQKNNQQNIKNGADEVRCYGVYGCFSLTAPWKSDGRPVALHPESPARMNVRFPVFNQTTRDRPNFLDLNEPERTKHIGIDPRGPIYMIAHGYIDTGGRPWIQRMVNELLDGDKYETASVIVIDWGGGSKPPYVQAVANIRLVGAIAAHIIHMIYDELQMKNVDMVHMIGHSLGAHLSGYAGYTLQKDFRLQLGRITGMDPAEPFFVDAEPLIRLDKSDAKYVDVIHSDATPFVSGGLGMSEAIGHVDFYPNGGNNNPGCDQTMEHYIQQEKGSFFWGFQQFLSCNHIRAHQFFTDSIIPKCPFTAITCDSYEDFKLGKCFRCGDNGHHCFQFGLHSYESYTGIKANGGISGNSPIKAYLMTNRDSPYCRTHYKVTISVSGSDESATHGGEIGKMSIVIHSHHNKKTEPIQVTENPIYYEPGFTYISVCPGSDVGIPKYATMDWEYKANPLNPLTWRLLTSPRVYVEYIIVESLEHKSRIKLCSNFNIPVVVDSPIVFRHENCHRLTN